jgi:hypothetical protein
MAEILTSASLFGEDYHPVTAGVNLTLGFQA